MLMVTHIGCAIEIRAVPLASPARGGFEELKAHFLLEKEQQQKSRLIGQYLSLLELPVTGPCLQATQIIHAARLDEGNLPEEMDLMEDYLQLVTHEYKRWEEDRQPCWPHPQRPPPFSVSQLSLVEIRCATPRCAYYVSVETQPHCHECFERRRAGEQGAEPSTGTTPSPRSAPPTAPSLSLYSETHAMKCKTAGCLFTLSVERQGLCERCYSARERPHDPPPLCSLCHQEAPHLSNGLCPVCLQWTARDRAGPTADSSQGSRAGGGDSSLSALHRQSTIGQPCKRSGCQYYGTPEKLGFCTICYVDYQTNHRPDSTAAPRLGPSSAALHSTPRCLSRDCNAPGLPMCEGYCNRCFVKEQGLRLHRAGVRAPRGPRSPTLGTRAAHLRQTQTQTRLQCSRSNCKNASAGWPELCSECQGRGGREGRRAHAHAHTHAHAHAHKDTPKTCRTQGCDHYANQDKQGYCNECDHFKQIYSP
ncbi:hypothetical protein JZ751_005322 [Albula glossodonta]|uniref:ubiquitinyl hydrolase 1 n=1 Tax=Albula glossodonta TaxID=121402 RepID=A0A8T2MVG5_9TELE|nr:hypothetical protein JZ751_005322 [Albula glossodonta]